MNNINYKYSSNLPNENLNHLLSLVIDYKIPFAMFSKILLFFCDGENILGK
jgi:hypothetical protein